MFGELAGAGPFLSLNVDHSLRGPVVVRGGVGYMGYRSGLPLTFIGGVSLVPAEGTYRPEVGLSATYFAGEPGFLLYGGVWPGFFGGVRFHTEDGSLLRLGVTVFVRPDLEGFGLGGALPWPSLSFGGRL